MWDNFRLHLTKPLREFIDARADWLTVAQLPTHVPAPNPAEGIWWLVRRDTGNLAAAVLGEVTSAARRRLMQLQYWPDVIDGCLATTGPAGRRIPNSAPKRLPRWHQERVRGDPLSGSGP
ncbi:hypothetical protein ABZV61_40905 [Streptomyces sp900116325]|uniref:DDE superfamily endonuclease n=1 Tax=Streptomyces sp. 900116325 TaxID=3154295 RepID=A0ABV2UM57_9ACTN